MSFILQKKIKGPFGQPSIEVTMLKYSDVKSIYLMLHDKGIREGRIKGTHKFWLWEKQYPILDTDSQHIQLSGEPCPRPARHLPPADTVPETSKGISTIL